jgi:hypothetical protein
MTRPASPEVMLTNTPAGHTVALPRAIRRALGALGRDKADDVWVWVAELYDAAYAAGAASVPPPTVPEPELSSPAAKPKAGRVMALTGDAQALANLAAREAEL